VRTAAKPAARPTAAAPAVPPAAAERAVPLAQPAVALEAPQQYGEAVVRQLLGARHIEDIPLPSSTIDAADATSAAVGDAPFAGAPSFDFAPEPPYDYDPGERED